MYRIKSLVFCFVMPCVWPRIILLFFIFPSIAFSQSPIQFVDPLIGTAPATTESSKRHSEAGSELKGQTIPAVGRPHGMTQWTPETRTTEKKCISPYYYNDKYLTGFRGTHWMIGSCTQDYGSVTIMPFTTNRVDTLTKSPISLYQHQSESVSPAYYSVFLEDFKVKAEMTGTVRSGFLRFRYPEKKENYFFVRVNNEKKEGKVWFEPEHNEIVGYNPVNRIYQGWGKSAGFSGYFVIRLNQSFTTIKINEQELIVCFKDKSTIQTQIGTSFTSINAARNNLNTEIKNWNFEQIRSQGEEEWNKSLNKIKVKGGSKDDQIKFYTALYHCCQLPRIVSDVDGSYQGFAQDTSIYKAIGFDYYDDFSMWDTYRTLHPLMTILEPKKSLDMIKSLIIKAQQGNWMPIFPAWGNYTGAMIGDHVSTMIADAYCRGITDFAVDTAYKYMRKNAFEKSSAEEYLDGKGRRALGSYMQYGYIPLEDSVPIAFHTHEQVSRTLEYALDDYVLAQFAKSLGKTKDYKILINRSQNYRNVFDKESGYVRGRYSNGTWIEPFNPNVKSFFITEGTASQYTWYVPHDITGLIDLMGGKKKFLKNLNYFFDKGYYWHGNETDQQAPYLFALSGEAEQTQKWVRQIVNEEYGTGPGGLSGNEDAGQMSAWLVSSMMGFYPVCPGKPEYVIGSPSFAEVTIQTNENSNPFIIKTEGPVLTTPYIDEIKLNGKHFSGYIIKHQQISSGGLLELKLKQPSKTDN